MGLRGWVMERGVKEMEKRGGKRENLKSGRAAVCLHLTRGASSATPVFPPHRT